MSNKSIILLAPLWLCLTQLLCAQQLNLLLNKADWDNNKDLPRCISGIDWSEKEKKLYLVSDQKDKIYQCDLSIVSDANGRYKFEVSKLKSFSIRGIFEDCNLEAIRVNDKGEIFVSAERGDRLLESFLWKGKMIRDTLIIDDTVVVDTVVVLDNLTLPNSFQKKKFRKNAGIEGITFSPDGTGLWIVNERAFTSDTNGSLVLTFQDFNRNETTYPYKITDPYLENGVSEILSLDQTRLLMLERHWNDAQKTVLADIFIATIDRKAANRKHFLSLNSLAIPHVDNYEGMCFGPVLKNGNRSLILISDNNRDWQDCVEQHTDILVFEIVGEKKDIKSSN